VEETTGSPKFLCLAYAGQMYLPQVLAAMARHLTYWWTFAVTVADQPKPIFARSVQAKWKPVVAFAKRPIKQAANWLADLLDGGGRDDRYHEWGQAEAEVVYLIQRLTEPGDLLVDPYAGGGAFLAAAKATHRRWLATERDEATALIARQRLAEMDRR
jgi:DNA modification methylase